MTAPTWTPCRVSLGSLKPWAANPRLSTKAQAKRILASFAKFGQVLAVAIGPDGEVYDGHQRLSALLTVHGAEYEIDARRASRALTDDERRALVITLHAGATGAWNWDDLAGWDAAALGEWGMDAAALKQWNTDAAALAAMLEAEKPAPVDAEPQIDRAEELRAKWGVEPGQLWRLGEHRLICGDCTDAGTVALLMQGEKAGAVVTDPPYGQNQLDVPGDEPEKHAELLAGCVRNFPVDNGIVIAFQSPRTFPNWMQAISGHKFLRSLWLYKEAQMANPWRGWILKSEMILVSEIGEGKWLDVHPFAHDCYKVSEVSFRTEKIASVRPHGSVKPLSVVQDLVSRVAGDIYEPFSGSGTTIIACERLGRRCRAVEISPAYVAVALERWATATGGTPELVEA